MRFSKFMSVLVVAGLMLSTVAAGTLKGNVNYQGKTPKKKTLKMGADPVCGSSHKGKVFNESFIVDDKNNLANVMVWLKDVKYTGAVTATPAVLDQNGCLYSPHVQGIMKGQELLIKNSDATLHNIHSMAKTNSQFNFAMPKVVKEKKVSFEKTEDPFYIKCDVHPWMKAWVGVFDHPYFAVTDANGNFSIENIPAGTYEVIAWQEKFKMKKHLTASVTIGEGETTKDFTFIRKSKKK
ncbi:MAG: hypothetical protein H8E72_00805 [Candidatus Marinimicrobia bacterium]|nr:hypothetical protein [Candidatus Neomarinimicrobiota bacterium]